MGGDTWQPLGPGLSPYTCSLCAHQPASLCPPPTAALWPSWRRRRWPTGHLHSSELSDNFSPATAAQLCPTLASWGSEPSPGAAAVIYKANFIKFVTIPWFPCREGHPLAAWLCQAQDCLPGLFTNETTLSIPRGGAPACMASRGQQSAGPAGKGQFLAGKQVRAGPAIPSVSAMPPAVLRTPPTPVHCRKPGPQPHRRGHHWAGTGRPGPVGLSSPEASSGRSSRSQRDGPTDTASPKAETGYGPTQPLDQHSRRAGVGGGLAPEVEVL